MPLNMLNEGGGTAFIRFSSDENAWLRSSEGGGLEEVETPFAVLIDIENVQLGWLKLSGGRDWQPWPNNDPTNTPKPSDAHKQGFSVKMYSTKVFGDEHLREFCASGTGTNMFIKKLYDECEATGEFGKGKVPAFKISKSKEKLKIGAGSTRIPPFEIVDWKDRPAEFADNAVAASSTSDATGAAAKSASASNADDDEDFAAEI